jgi:hypothetical protein
MEVLALLKKNQTASSGIKPAAFLTVADTALRCAVCPVPENLYFSKTFTSSKHSFFPFPQIFKNVLN